MSINTCCMCNAQTQTHSYVLNGGECEVCEECVSGVVGIKRVFKIPSPNWSNFIDRFEKLARKAKRLDCATPTYTVLREELKTIKVAQTFVDYEHSVGDTVMVDRAIVMHVITIECEPVCLMGYEFCASIDHSPEGNVVHTLKGVSPTPVHYRTAAADCDHCGYERRRNNTFVVRHIESGEYKQIGRNCLAAYIGSQSAETFAQRAELYSEYFELGDASENEGGEGWGSGGKRYTYLDRYLSVVAEVIAHVGWRSNSVAREHGGVSTSSLAITHLDPPRSRIEREARLFEHPTNKSVETAKAAIEWCAAISDAEVENNEYLWNIRVIAKRGLIEDRQFGYAASIVSSYQKHIGELKRKERQAPSEWVGEIGKRMEFTLTIEKAITLEGAYGLTTLHLMRDEQGNVFKWNSSGEVFEVGETVKLKGTVKKHSTYRDVKQTELSRCKRISEK